MSANYTNAQMLSDVETAIQQTLSSNAVSYSIGGRTVQRLPLKDLYAMRQQLQLAVNRDANGIFYAAQFRRPE